MSTKVLLVDDQELLRATFRLLLDAAADVEVVGEAGDGVEALTRLREAPTDVVLMDLRMPRMDGIEATRRIVADPDLADVRVLVLTTFEDDDLVLEALRAGASGFLGKGVSPAKLLEAVATIATGDQLLSPAATRAVVRRIGQVPAPRERTDSVLQHLTERELELVRWVATGLSNVEIAERLVLSPATVKTHVNRAMMKTGSRDRAQLVVLAYETGIAVPGSAPDRRPD